MVIINSKLLNQQSNLIKYLGIIFLDTLLADSLENSLNENKEQSNGKI